MSRPCLVWCFKQGILWQVTGKLRKFCNGSLNLPVVCVMVLLTPSVLSLSFLNQRLLLPVCLQPFLPSCCEISFPSSYPCHIYIIYFYLFLSLLFTIVHFKPLFFSLPNFLHPKKIHQVFTKLDTSCSL